MLKHGQSGSDAGLREDALAVYQNFNGHKLNCIDYMSPVYTKRIRSNTASLMVARRQTRRLFLSESDFIQSSTPSTTEAGLNSRLSAVSYSPMYLMGRGICLCVACRSRTDASSV